MLERFKENVYYFFTGSVGLVLGLAPLVIIAVAIALLIERTDLVLKSPLESSQSQDLANSMLSLLVAFLVSKNIDANLKVHDAVDAVRTSSVELASLAYSVRSDACNSEIDEIIEATLGLDMADVLDIRGQEEIVNGVIIWNFHIEVLTRTADRVLQAVRQPDFVSDVNAIWENTGDHSSFELVEGSVHYEDAAIVGMPRPPRVKFE